MIDQLLDEIIKREGSKDTLDRAGRSKYGISEKYHPEAWKNGPPTLEMAKQIYFQIYFITPKLHLINPNYLQAQLMDFGVLSGPMVAIQHLQRALNIGVDGVIGPITLSVLGTQNPEVVNQKLVVSRGLMLARLVQKRPSDLQYLFGWLNRVFSFLRS